MTAREVLKLLHKDDWYDFSQEGSHLQLKHTTRPGKITVAVHSDRADRTVCADGPGKITVAVHSGKDIAPGTLKRSRMSTIPGFWNLLLSIIYSSRSRAGGNALPADSRCGVSV